MNGRLEDTGKFLLRVTVAVLLLFHGIAKVHNGNGFVERMMGEAGLPAFLAYGAYVGEVVAPILLILGVFTRLAALVVAFDMVGAVGLARRDDVFSLGPGGGSWAIEVEAFFFFTALAVACLGAGKLALGRPGRWN